MVQHLILVALAPPLLIAGAAPMRTLFWRNRPRPSALVLSPAIAAGLYGLAIWFWHIPYFYEVALTSALAHLAMVGSLLAAALLFWSAIFAASRHAEHAGMAVLVLLGTLVHTGLLGALLSMSRAVWYPVMSAGSTAWGLSPIEDQQLAGLLMWVPMGLVYLLAALAVVAAALANLRARTS
jgi:cytochrome c oxidase assembly factor CtaG